MGGCGHSSLTNWWLSQSEDTYSLDLATDWRAATLSGAVFGREEYQTRQEQMIRCTNVSN